MGMWTPKESIEQELSALHIKPVQVHRKDFPLKLLNDILHSNQELVVIGFDILQVPRYKMIYKLDSQHD